MHAEIDPDRLSFLADYPYYLSTRFIGGGCNSYISVPTVNPESMVLVVSEFRATSSPIRNVKGFISCSLLYTT